MKMLKPSHREKKRYLLIIGKDANSRIIKDAILDFIGILGYSKTSLKIIKNSSGKLIISINRDSLNLIRTSFIISGKDIKIKNVSGSIKNIKSD